MQTGFTVHVKQHRSPHTPLWFIVLCSCVQCVESTSEGVRGSRRS
jgi:hypothetical protein